jgi:hypothetical protein
VAKLLARIIATVIGVGAAVDLARYGYLLQAFNAHFVMLWLTPVLLALYSVAGVVGAVGAWRLTTWSWWLVVWYCALTILRAAVPALSDTLDADALLVAWLLFAAASLAYFFSPGIRASYQVATSVGKTLLIVVGAAFLCVVAAMAYPYLQITAA